MIVWRHAAPFLLVAAGSARAHRIRLGGSRERTGVRDPFGGYELDPGDGGTTTTAGRGGTGGTSSSATTAGGGGRGGHAGAGQGGTSGSGGGGGIGQGGQRRKCDGRRRWIGRWQRRQQGRGRDGWRRGYGGRRGFGGSSRIVRGRRRSTRRRTRRFGRQGRLNRCGNRRGPARMSSASRSAAHRTSAARGALPARREVLRRSTEVTEQAIRRFSRPTPAPRNRALLVEHGLHAGHHGESRELPEREPRLRPHRASELSGRLHRLVRRHGLLQIRRQTPLPILRRNRFAHEQDHRRDQRRVVRRLFCGGQCQILLWEYVPGQLLQHGPVRSAELDPGRHRACVPRSEPSVQLPLRYERQRRRVAGCVQWGSRRGGHLLRARRIVAQLELAGSDASRDCVRAHVRRARIAAARRSASAAATAIPEMERLRRGTDLHRVRRRQYRHRPVIVRDTA